MRVSDERISDAEPFVEYWDRIVVYFSVIRCAPAAEDLASEVITRVLSAIDAGEMIRDVGAYMYAVARNVRFEDFRDKFESHEQILDHPRLNPAQPSELVATVL